MKEASHKRSSASLKVTDRPKVSFGPYVEKHNAKQKQKDVSKQTRHAARGHYTPNPGNSRTSVFIKSFYQVTHIHKPQIHLFVESVFSTFFQIKVTVTALHLIISVPPVHVALVWICLTPPTPSYILLDWLTPASTGQKGAPASRRERKRKKGWEVNSVLLLFHTLRQYLFLLTTYKNHIRGCFFISTHLCIHLPG